MRKLILLTFITISGLTGFCQEKAKDSTVRTVRERSLDTVYLRGGRKRISVEAYTKRFDPRKALFFSAILPGAGQAYNKKYWKIPMVYGGLIGLGLVVKYYNDGVIKYKDQLYYNLNHPNITYNPVSGATTQTLRNVVDAARHQRDYFTIMTGLFYLLQMVDAHVDAHLKEFDVNPRMHVRLQPTLGPGGAPGFGLTMKF